MTAEESRIAIQERQRQANMEQYGFGPNIMRGIRVCTVCGMGAAASRKWCDSCGAALPSETLFQQYRRRHRFCRNCDTVVAEYTRFCPQCGNKIKLLNKT